MNNNIKKVGLVALTALSFLPATTVYASGSGAEAFTGVGEHTSFVPDEVSPFSRAVTTVSVGGGEWKRGTSATVTAKKKVISEFKHGTKQSKTSVEIDGNVKNSGDSWTARGAWAKSSITGKLSSTGYTYYNTK